MLITSSCGIRLVVPPLVPSGDSPLASACSMSSPYALTLRPVISSLLCLTACRLPLRSSARASSRFAPSSISVPVLLPPHGFSPPAPPHRHDGRGDTTGLWRFSRLCLLASRLAISSVRSASDGDGGVAYSAPWPSSVPPATRSLAQSDFLAVLPSHRFHRLPSPITRHVGRGGASWSRLLVFAVLFRLLSICVGSVYCGGGGCLACLNGVYLFLSMGDVVARRCVSGL